MSQALGGYNSMSVTGVYVFIKHDLLNHKYYEIFDQTVSGIDYLDCSGQQTH